MIKRLLGKLLNSALHSKHSRRYGNSSDQYRRTGPHRHSSSDRYSQRRPYGSSYYKKRKHSSS
ncbi:hypothetical protein WMW72_25170 [Paenibacillus filicis]|uniref:Uncharacterized protein n=1 Tax=Paenibacillus filicis TaxID=669464 RepID=A0ABU9DSP8_9BACL